MRFLVIGCGSIGRRHMRNLLELGQEVSACDTVPENRKWAEENLRVRTFASAEEAFKSEKFDAALVCTPPNTHIKLASLALENGAHVFVEKPVSDSLDGVAELEKKAKKAKLAVQVGYNLRYVPGLAKMKEIISSGAYGKALSARVIFAQYLPYWRPGTDYRKSYTAQRAMGGGIILDGSHELDCICWLMGKPVRLACFARKVSSLEVDAEDTADILIDFERGAVANLHLDFVRQDYSRSCELHCEKGTLVWRLEQKSGRNTLELRTCDSQSGGVKSEMLVDVPWEPNAMYVEEMRAFIAACRGEKEPSPTLAEGALALRVALRALESSEKGKALRI